MFKTIRKTIRRVPPTHIPKLKPTTQLPPPLVLPVVSYLPAVPELSESLPSSSQSQVPAISQKAVGSALLMYYQWLAQKDRAKRSLHSLTQDTQPKEQEPLLAPAFELADLAPLPYKAAQAQFNAVLKLFNNKELKQAFKTSPALEILYKRIETSIFHLNIIPVIDETNRPEYAHITNQYPYDPVYESPFPYKPSLEAMSDIAQILTMISQDKTLALRAPIRKQAKDIAERLRYFVYDSILKYTNPNKEIKVKANKAISKSVIMQQPVDAYLMMQKRLLADGELASFPEFEETVNASLKALDNEKIRDLCKLHPLLAAEVKAAKQTLEAVRRSSGDSEGSHPAFNAPFPYRRTYLAIKKAVAVCDMAERLVYPESQDWHEVEESWFKTGATKKLLPLYHVNRYSYQEYGLLSNPNIVLLPWIGDVSMEELVLLRAAPFSLVGVIFETIRVDRHHNSPLDFWVHDINHGRRLFGYFNRRLQTEIGLDYLEHPKAVEAAIRSSEAYLSKLIAQTDPHEPGLSTHQKWIRIIQHHIIFETFHETALDGTRDALLNDLYRKPNTPQPFEVLSQKPVSSKKEELRTLDGNLKSGADNLALNISQPTKVTYFFDRAPGFLPNVFNKLVFGFHQSVFVDRHSSDYVKHMTPENLAEAAIGLFEISGVKPEDIPSKQALISQIADMSGQTELRDYYFSLEKEQCSALMSRSKHQMEQARALRKAQPDASASEIAKAISITEYQRDLLKWMLKDLKDYDRNFAQYFSEKMKRTKRQEFQNAKDFKEKFVGKGKYFLSSLTPSTELQTNKPGTLFIDDSAVPFFNKTIQTTERAHMGLKKTIETFEKEDLDNPKLSLHRFTELVALFGRPEFDDIRRYKLKLFPDAFDLLRFGKERNDNKMISDRFPDEFFIITNEELFLDQLSFTFGQHTHFVRLISHSESRKADEKHFGTSDFLEQNYAHGYFSIEIPAPGSSEDWVKIHDEFIQRQVRETDPKAKLMNSLVYFYFTHESGYRSMIPDLSGKEPLANAYKDDLAVIKQRIENLNDFDFIKNSFKEFEDKEIRDDYLEKAFDRIAPLLKNHIDRLRNEEANFIDELDLFLIRL